MSLPPFAIVLPARYQSSRFPGKPLALVAGKPLIEWVYGRASAIDGVGRVIVATDDDRIASAVRAFGGEAVITRPEHATGTDRVAEVAASLKEPIVVNLQGDEPVFPPALVLDMVRVLRDEAHVDIVTAAHTLHDPGDIDNVNAVKVVTDLRGRALYFSRAGIPARSHPSSAGDGVLGYRHVGIYVFRRDKLLEFARLARTPLEIAENLEQLRALENGMVIRIVVTQQPTVGVDVPSDIKNLEKALASA